MAADNPRNNSEESGHRVDDAEHREETLNEEEYEPDYASLKEYFSKALSWINGQYEKRFSDYKWIGWAVPITTTMSMYHACHGIRFAKDPSLNAAATDLCVGTALVGGALLGRYLAPRDKQDKQ